MLPLLLLYTKILQDIGWKSAAVTTSVSSSMFAGLISTMLKDLSVIPAFHKLIRRSSADKNVSPSLFIEMELIW
jgi:hypothetical protein